MASFDPPVVLAILVAAHEPGKRKKFEDEYKANVSAVFLLPRLPLIFATLQVAKRVASWTKNREKQSQYQPQLEFEAHVAEYVAFLYTETRPTRTTKNSNTVPKPKTLKPSIPIYGPRFTPPSLIDVRRRGGSTRPEIAYLRPINIVHPFFYPLLTKCPHCGSDDVAWDSWNGTGSREVHGVRREETALGYQLRHKDCIPDSGGTGTKSRSFVTTNQVFWKNWEHWEIPRGIPYFTSRSAVTRELFDIIVEFRPSTTSGGLAENIKQLHLLEYHEYSLEFLRAYQEENFKPGTLTFPRTFSPISPPTEQGYNDTSITDDFIRDIYMGFIDRTRSEESTEYLKNLNPGICLSTDNTFKVAGKATVVDTTKTRTKLMKGGILSIINELNEIIAWRFCQSASPAELFEVLEGIKKRCEELGVELPSMLVSDDCCKIEKEARKAMPDLQICLDVYHFMMRYLAAILNGTQNPRRGAVAVDIRNAVLKKSAEKDAPAQYWSKEEQETKMVAVYEKYSRMGGVWSAAAHAVHAAQLKHLRKGCLSRNRQDIASDGSRIEGSHKGWNGLQRAVASGIELQNGLCHDFALRRNLRIASSRKPGTPGSHAFVCSTFGSHHTRLVNQTSFLFNSIQLSAAKAQSDVSALIRPTLRNIQSGEKFGLVSSNHSDTFGGLLTIKSEDEDEAKVLIELGENSADQQPEVILAEFGIDPALLQKPETPQLSVASDRNTQQLTAKRKHSESVSADHDDNPVSANKSATNVADVNASGPPQPKKSRLADNTAINNTSRSNTPLHPFFNSAPAPTVSTSLPQTQTVPLHPSGHQVEPALARVIKLLPLPDASGSATRLTRSQRLFMAGTTTNPKSLQIARGPEFFLFMDMRKEFGWKASDMTSKKWAEAVGKYNERLLQKDGIPGAVSKAPRALISKLGEIERMVLERIATNDFVARTSGKVEYWKEHCYAVQLIKPSTSSEGGKTEGKSPRKVAACLRCNKVMYPGPNKAPENHKKGHCSDGFKQKSTDDNSAPWPQPTGIFTMGSEFHPLLFLVAIRDLYEKVLIEQNHGSLNVEDEAFSLMLQQPGRIISVNGAVLFKLFSGYAIPAADQIPDNLMVNHDGVAYLRIDSLADTETTFSSSQHM
ncbi:hypothetical protein R3P38DRAFT_3173760 [Favolaschia claudopus]|uniref:Transposase n=1 Tax=Favolaschia claudopus TaxID=2862362 RepID=A0AAW0DFS1_9AGAR